MFFTRLSLCVRMDDKWLLVVCCRITDCPGYLIPFERICHENFTDNFGHRCSVCPNGLKRCGCGHQEHIVEYTDHVPAWFGGRDSDAGYLFWSHGWCGSRYRARHLYDDSRRTGNKCFIGLTANSSGFKSQLSEHTASDAWTGQFTEFTAAVLSSRQRSGSGVSARSHYSHWPDRTQPNFPGGPGTGNFADCRAGTRWCCRAVPPQTKLESIFLVCWSTRSVYAWTAWNWSFSSLRSLRQLCEPCG